VQIYKLNKHKFKDNELNFNEINNLFLQRILGKMDFSHKLISWYSNNKRDLPWRNTTDPYKIWLSEVILQQTRVNQGLPYFEKFANTYPTVIALAKADEQDVLKLWQGLGYYSRARNMHATAKLVVEQHNSVFPTSYQELLKLKGIGSYTAAAIASFSSNEKVCVVDGNVFRVLARVFNIDEDISKLTTKRHFEKTSLELLADNSSDIYNQAIMEFGALHCTPKNPKCETCIFDSICLAKKLNKIDELPKKVKKIKVTNRYFHYFLIEDKNGNYTASKRTEKGIWQNLYELPLIETESDCELSSYKNESALSISQYNVVHKLSHQKLYIKFYRLLTNSKLTESYNKNELMKLPFPIVLHNFLEKIGF
jgi:A/G-specific adenine glycosylase